MNPERKAEMEQWLMIPSAIEGFQYTNATLDSIHGGVMDSLGRSEKVSSSERDGNSDFYDRVDEARETGRRNSTRRSTSFSSRIRLGESHRGLLERISNHGKTAG